MRFRGVLLAGGLALVLAVFHFSRGPGPDPLIHFPPPPGPVPVEGEISPLPVSGHVPTGAPPALSCVAARAIVAQINTRLVQPPEPIDEQAFGTSVVDWLDPHGLWSAAPSSAVGDAVRANARGLLGALRGSSSSQATCRVAVDVGRVLVREMDELRRSFDGALASVPRAPSSAFFESIFEPGDVKRPASVLAQLLGERVGAFDATVRARDDMAARDGGGWLRPELVSSLIATARDRYFPSLSAEAWGDAVLAAAVRAYVPSVDPHGAWAPFEEEASLYESELEARPPAPFWEAISRTPIGVRIDAGPLAPLLVGDLVLSIEGIPLGGMPLEQIEQLAYALAEERPRATMLVFSEGGDAPREIVVELPAPESVVATREGLGSERVRYGDGDALVVAIRDVREDLGEELAAELEHARGGGPFVGVVLDLRGNGGGSTDGAAAALGIFLPGAPLFPMRRRDGTLEIDRATEPTGLDRWEGPVAAVVDRSTASAAEMIAGALGAYHRGVVVGERTFGKGCAQEYVEDESDVGVLRLTTLVFALPDGSPLQRTGLLPQILVPFGSPGGETEANLRGSPAPFRGPDVRDPRRVAAWASRSPWPAPRVTSAAVVGAKGSAPSTKPDVGPCHDPDVCRSLRALADAGARRAAKR